MQASKFAWPSLPILLPRTVKHHNQRPSRRLSKASQINRRRKGGRGSGEAPARERLVEVRLQPLARLPPKEGSCGFPQMTRFVHPSYPSLFHLLFLPLPSPPLVLDPLPSPALLFSLLPSSSLPSPLPLSPLLSSCPALPCPPLSPLLSPPLTCPPSADETSARYPPLPSSLHPTLDHSRCHITLERQLQRTQLVSRMGGEEGERVVLG